jgi:uncharacterized protein
MAPFDKIFTVDLRGLSEGRCRLHLSEPGSKLELPEEELNIGSDVDVDLTIDRTGSLITASGEISAVPAFVCARCLEDFHFEVTAKFDAVIRMGRNDYRLEDEEESPVEFGDDWVSFAPTIRESLILAVPMKPLCRDDCQGLCQRCGVNLNESQCSCPGNESDPRWGALETLLEENRGE